MSGMRATSPMKADVARQMRATAAQVDQTHPEMVTGKHLRNAATMLQAGQPDAAKRHLDAAMELMTPRNLIRHGVTDDEGHAQAKAAMHQINVHRLNVMDIQDHEAANAQQAQHKRDTVAQQAQAAQAARQVRAQAAQARAGARTAAPPTGTGPGSQQQGGPAPDPILVSSNPAAGGILLAYDSSEARGLHGMWVGKRVMFRDQASGKGVTVHGTVKNATAATGRNRYARLVIRTDKGDHVTRDASTVRLIPAPKLAGNPKDIERARRMGVLNKDRQHSAGFSNVDLSATGGITLASWEHELRGKGGRWTSGQHAAAAAVHIKAARKAPSKAAADQHRQLAGMHAEAAGFHNLPPDVMQALNKYDSDISAGRIQFGSGKFASAYPGKAATDAQVGRFAGQHVLNYSGGPGGMVDLSARTGMLERTPAPYGKPGGPGLYGKAGNKHSDYFEQVVQALMKKRGMDKAQASRIAWGALRKWRRGGGHVHPEVMAAAGKALGQEAAAGARAHSHTAGPWETADRLIELACGPFDLAGFNPAQARVPAGQAGGGRFGGGSGGAAQPGGKGTRAQRRAKLVKQAVTLRGEIAQLLLQLHAATHHTGKSKSATPRKKGAAAVSAKAAAAGKAAAHKSKTSTRAASKTMTLAQMRTRLGVLRAELHTVMQQIHQLAGEERAAIELASGYSEAWRHELRGPHGQFVGGGGGPRTAAARRSVSRRAMVSAGSGTAVRHPRARSLNAQAGGTGLRTEAARHGTEIGALADELKARTAAVQESAAQDAEQRARAAANATHQHLIQVEKNLDKIDQTKHRQKLVVHVMALVAGAILTYLAAKLGTPELLTANLAPGALTIQELIDWRKRL